MEKKPPNMALDIEEGSVNAEHGREVKMPALPKALTLEEKKFLLSVERGDLSSVKKIIHRAKRHQTINLNCMDPMGRGALLMAIDNENLQMVELLVVMGVETKDALLHAIDKEFVEAVELLLEHEELIHKEGDQYSWEKVDRTTSSFTPDITPLILAAHRNNYEILKILLDRGATLPMPHDVRCGCVECIRGVKEDSLRHSMSRINAYRALSSPSLIALSSTDPILTAFELSVELKNLAYAETEFRQEYMDLRRQCQEFAGELLGHTRSSQELAILLNHDPTSLPYADGEHMKLARLELAIDYKQKKFVAHPNIQQLLGAIWYEGLPGFRRKSPAQKVVEVCQIAVLFPVYCLFYILAPGSSHAQLMRKPFMKFLIHASSYLFFLFLLILVSQRFEVLVIQMFGTMEMKIALKDQLRRQRGNGPTYLECVVAIYVLGYICDEVKEVYRDGIVGYCRNMWNFIDLSRNLTYTLVMILRTVAYFQQQKEIAANPSTAFIPREEWDDYDPQLIAEGLFAMANIFSAIKLVHLFSINPYLGPLQISLGRMVIDIVKFFFIYSLVLFAFACGLNQLLWYFSDLEKQKCYSLPDGQADWKNNGDACLKWRRFANLFESSQSLFWASFGLVDLTNFELTGVKSYTRFWGLLMFGSYSVINVVVLLNLLIAMMSNSYSLITEHSDTEWKFARSKLWMSYFELGSTLPPPFNLLPTPKDLMQLLGVSQKERNRRLSSKRRQSHIRERDYRYAAVMRSLVWRYIIAMHRRQEMSEVTEDDVNEVKGDISTLRFELLEVFKINGMDISCASKNTKAALGRKMRVWERRLLRDFHVVSVAGEEGAEDSTMDLKNTNDPGDRFRRLAMMVVSANSQGSGEPNKLGSGRNIKSLSHIGRSMSSDSFKSSQNLRKAMDEANRLTVMEPTPEGSPRGSPLPTLPSSGSSVLEMLQNIQEDEDSIGDQSPAPGRNNKSAPADPKFVPNKANLAFQKKIHQQQQKMEEQNQHQKKMEEQKQQQQKMEEQKQQQQKVEEQKQQQKKMEEQKQQQQKAEEQKQEQAEEQKQQQQKKLDDQKKMEDQKQLQMKKLDDQKKMDEQKKAEEQKQQQMKKLDDQKKTDELKEQQKPQPQEVSRVESPKQQQQQPGLVPSIVLDPVATLPKPEKVSRQSKTALPDVDKPSSSKRTAPVPLPEAVTKSDEPGRETANRPVTATPQAAAAAPAAPATAPAAPAAPAPPSAQLIPPKKVVDVRTIKREQGGGWM